MTGRRPRIGVLRAAMAVSVLAACACPSKPTVESGSGSSRNGSAGSGAPVTACEAVRGKLEQLYRAEAQQHEPTRVAQAVADNTAMVMADCAKAPTTVPACIRAATTAKQLEATCLAPLDDDGREGDAIGGNDHLGQGAP